MSNNLVTFNENKAEILPVGPNYKRDAVLSKLGHLALQTWSQVRNLGVILDSYLTFAANFNSLTQTAFGSFAQYNKGKTSTAARGAEKLMHAFISSCRGYCSGLYSGPLKAAITKLQTIQSAAARVWTKTVKRDHITPGLYHLHWPPVFFRIDFKILL